MTVKQKNWTHALKWAAPSIQWRVRMVCTSWQTMYIEEHNLCKSYRCTRGCQSVLCVRKYGQSRRLIEYTVTPSSPRLILSLAAELDIEVLHWFIHLFGFSSENCLCVLSLYFNSLCLCILQPYFYLCVFAHMFRNLVDARIFIAEHCFSTFSPNRQ